MSTTRSRTGELIAGAAGIGLLITMFLPWLGVSEEEEEAVAGLGVETDLPTTNAWESFTFLDIALLVPVLAGIGLALVALTSNRPTPRAAAAGTGAVAALGALAIFYRMLRPLHDAGLEYGIFLGLACCLLLVVGAWIAMQSAPEDEPATARS